MDLFHIVNGIQQSVLPTDVGNSYPYFGTVVSGGGVQNVKMGWDVRFDVLPIDCNVVSNITRSKLTVLAPGEEEVVGERGINHAELLEQVENDEEKEKKKESPMLKCQRDFAGLTKDTILAANVFRMTYDIGPEDHFTWEILGDGEHNVDQDFVPPASTNVVSNSFDYDEAKEDNFFQHVFPSIEGHGIILDKYLGDPRAPYHDTVKVEKIKFHDPEDPDPDWKVKQCYLIIIAAATQFESGYENLWRRGMKGRLRLYPDFGRFMGINEMKAFCSAAPFCWADEVHWYKPQRDTPWEVFLPALSEFNDRRRLLVKTMLLMLDESMSGWRPKTSKFGGLPNYTYEPRKPVPLGTMFRNGVECMSGVLVHQDVVQLSEVQSRKDFFNELSHLPGEVYINVHASEVLRQVSGAGIPEGGWVGGDAWFGSVLAAVEVKKRLGVYSTFVVKQNVDYFPMIPLCSVLKARYGDRPAGHWVVFCTELSGVKVLAIAYAWSQTSIAYFVSTCGSTQPSETCYETHFEDEYGVITTKQIARPHVLEWVYDYLPLIDEHNKQRQNILGLEKKWPTKNCWFRLLVTLVGMSVVDLHRIYLNHDKGKYQLMSVLQFLEELCLKLRLRDTRGAKPLRYIVSNSNGTIRLERIKNSSGEIARLPSDVQQRKHNRGTGSSITANCFVRRKYIYDKDKANYVQTSFCCIDCKMPLCKADRRGNKRELTCYEEHRTSTDLTLGCNNVPKRHKKMRKDLQVYVGRFNNDSEDETPLATPSRARLPQSSDSWDDENED